MVHREDLRIAFYDEIEAAVSGLSENVFIGSQYPEQDEQLPAIIHDDAYRQVPFNNKTGVKSVSTDQSGADVYHYSMVKEAQFTLTAAAESESVKESLYHAIEEHFEAYTFPIRDVSDIHADISRLEFADVNSNDDEDRNTVGRQDTISILVEYERVFDLDVDALTEIENQFGVDDGDGETNITFTTT